MLVLCTTCDYASLLTVLIEVVPSMVVLLLAAAASWTVAMRWEELVVDQQPLLTMTGGEEELVKESCQLVQVEELDSQEEVRWHTAHDLCERESCNGGRTAITCYTDLMF